MLPSRPDSNRDLQLSNPSDCRRLTFLGLLLIVFGAIALVAEYRATLLPDNFNGISAIFGGAAMIVVFLKLGPCSLYAEWISAASFYVCAGLVLRLNHLFSNAEYGLLLCLFLTLSALSRIRIGLSKSHRNASLCMLSSGLLTIVGTLLIGAALVQNARDAPALIVALDTIFLGISIANFAYARQVK